MKCSASYIQSGSERGGCISASDEVCKRLSRSRARMDGGDAEAFGGPSDVEADDVALANQIDPGHLTADTCAQDRHERKLERDLFAAMRSHYAAAARAIELEDHPLVEIVRKPFAVEFVCHVRSLYLRALGKSTTSQFVTREQPHVAAKRCISRAKPISSDEAARAAFNCGDS